MVVLGGGLWLFGESLRAAVQDQFPPLLMALFRPGPPVATARFGEDPVPWGCCCRRQSGTGRRPGITGLRYLNRIIPVSAVYTVPFCNRNTSRKACAVSFRPGSLLTLNTNSGTDNQFPWYRR